MFDSVALNRNGWHAKLQRWMFGYIPFKNNFCPFFWLTIFCVLASPFVGLCKGVKWTAINAVDLFMMAAKASVGPLERAVSFTLDVLEERICKPWYDSQTERFLEKMDNKDAYGLFGSIFGWRWDDSSELDTKGYRQAFNKLGARVKKRYLDRWNLWKEKTGGDWEIKLKEVREQDLETKRLLAIEEAQRSTEKYEAGLEKDRLKAIRAKELDKERARKKAIREKKLRALYTKLAIYTKYPFYLAVGIVTIYVIYGLSLLGIVIVENLSAIIGSISSVFSAIWSFITFIAPFVGAALIGIPAIIFMVVVITKLIQKCTLTIELPEFPNFDFSKIPGIKHTKTSFMFMARIFAYIGQGLNFVGQGFTYVGRKVKGVALKGASAPKGVTKFFTIYVKAVKENNCPAIDWEE